jgi:tetratricopeptide (TPR) repeat protein
MVRNDEDVPVTLVDLRDCGWEAIVQNNSHEGYVSLWQAFSNAAGAAVEKDELRKGKCLRLLANATSMMLSPASVTNPFKPMLLLSDGRRSALPSDFAPGDVKLLTHFLELIDNPWLKARLSDMAWLLLTPRDPRFALIAIEEYMRIPLELEAWIAGGDDCWRRAASIAMMLKRAGEKQLEAIESTVLSAFLRLEVNHGFMAFWLAEFLEKHRLGKAAAYAISERLHAIALALEMQNEFHASRGYFEQAAHWFLMLGDQKSSAQMLAGLAKVWEREGEAALSSETPSNMAASGFYEKAIQSYRRIPRALRDEHEVDKRIAELRFKLNKTGAEALGEMHVVSSDPIDIAEIIDHASNHVKGKSPLDALNALVTVMRQVSVISYVKDQNRDLRNFRYRHFFPGCTFRAMVELSQSGQGSGSETTALTTMPWHFTLK